MQNENKNEVDTGKLPKYKGKQVLKVFNVIIPEKGEAEYMCLMDDGGKEPVPAKLFKK